MTSGIQFLLALIVSIVLMLRWRLFPLPASLRQRILCEVHGRLKVSAPHLRSTLDGVSFDSGSSTSR